jgi:hypothetical protein
MRGVKMSNSERLSPGNAGPLAYFCRAKRLYVHSPLEALSIPTHHYFLAGYNFVNRKFSIHLWKSKTNSRCSFIHDYCASFVVIEGQTTASLAFSLPPHLEPSR